MDMQSCKLGVIYQERFKIEVKLPLRPNRKSYSICRVDWYNNGWPWVTLNGHIVRYLCGSWASCFFSQRAILIYSSQVLYCQVCWWPSCSVLRLSASTQRCSLYSSCFFGFIHRAIIRLIIVARFHVFSSRRLAAIRYCGVLLRSATLVCLSWSRALTFESLDLETLFLIGVQVRLHNI